jgi:hypothetical protein
MKRRKADVHFAICINDGSYVDDLKVGTVYQVLPDESAAKSNYLRVVGETGEDYLYPAAYFVLTEVPPEAEQALLQRDHSRVALPPPANKSVPRTRT